MDPILVVFLELIRQNAKFNSGGARPHRNKSWGPRPMLSLTSATYAYVSFKKHYVRNFNG